MQEAGADEHATNLLRRDSEPGSDPGDLAPFRLPNLRYQERGEVFGNLKKIATPEKSVRRPAKKR